MAQSLNRRLSEHPVCSRYPCGERIEVCSICGGEPTAVYRDREFDVYRCRDCGTLLSGCQATDIANQYGADYFRDFETHYKEYRLRQYRQVLPMLAQASPGRRLLDVGCGLGYFVEEAQRNGWDAAGIDISDAAIAYATQERHVSNLVCGRFEDYLPSPQGFHTIAFWDVLEHMPYPREALLRARDLLVDDGILVVKVPSTGSLVLKSALLLWLLSGKLVDRVKARLQVHLFYFTPESIRYLVESVGFQVLSLRRQTEHLIIFNDRKPTTLAKVGIKHLLSLPQFIIPPTRRELLLIARKPRDSVSSRRTAEPEVAAAGQVREGQG